MTTWSKPVTGLLLGIAVGFSFPALRAMAGNPPGCEEEPGCGWRELPCGQETQYIIEKEYCCWTVNSSTCEKEDLGECTNRTIIGGCLPGMGSGS
jgi:hypothetical protein